MCRRSCSRTTSPSEARRGPRRARRSGSGLKRAAPVLLLLAAACASPEPAAFVHPRADLSGIKRVAVLPFESLTGEREAGRKVQDLFTIELLALELFEVAEPGEVVRAFAKVSLDPNAALDPSDIKKLSEVLKVQAFFLGAVSEYRERPIGSLTSPEVAVAIRLVEVESGQVLWTAAAGRSGLPWATRLFGVNEQSLQETSLEVVREALRTLTEGSG